MASELSGRRRCILVPIDLYGINPATLETLVRIARQLDRTLLGLLLEDVRLQQVADLPFTTEITLSSGQERSLLRDHLSQRYNLVSADTRRLLNELAERNRVQLTFENAAGQRLHTALERKGQLDIFFPARQRWRLLEARWPLRGAPIRRLGVLLPHGGQNQQAVETARLLLDAGLVGDVYLLTDSPPASQQLRALYRPGHRICVRSNLNSGPAELTALIHHSPYDLLLLSREALAGIAPETLDVALEKSGGQVLVIN
jgi:hypothetical protein